MTDHPRQPAFDAVYDILRTYPPRCAGDDDQAAENARVWRAVEAALDAMGVPAVDLPHQSAFTPGENPFGTDATLRINRERPPR